MKICTKCFELLPKDSFAFTNKKKGYVRGDCKECIKKYNSKYYVYNNEKIKEATKKFRKENPKLANLRIEKAHTARKEHYSKLKSINYQNNKDAYRSKQKKWIINNPKRYKQLSVKHAQQRRSRERGVIHHFTDEQWERCKRHFQMKCSYCGSSKKLEQDHFIPLSSGGEYTIDNIVPSCKSCNSSKGNKEFEDWYRGRDFYCIKNEEKIFKYLRYENKIQQLSIF